MSYTTLYAIAPDGHLHTFARYQNSHGGAPAVWSILAHKYIADAHDPDGGPFQPGKRHWLTDPTLLRELFDLIDDPPEWIEHADSPGLLDWERMTLLSTADQVCVSIEYVPAFAAALEKFAKVHGPALAERGHAFSIGEQAADLHRVTSAVRGTCLGIAWNQTSVCDTFVGPWSHDYQESEDFNIFRHRGYTWATPSGVCFWPSARASQRKRPKRVAKRIAARQYFNRYADAS